MRVFNALDAICLLLAAAMIVFYFADVLPGLGWELTSPIIVAAYWLVVAVLVTPPLSRFFSEKAMGTLFGTREGKASRDYSRAKSLAAQGRFEEAIEEFRRGLEKEPDNIMLRLEIAEIYSREMNDFHGAISELEECLKLKLGPTQGASILNRMADIYETNLGDMDAAVGALRTIQKTWPETKLAQRAQERIKAIEGQSQSLD